MSDTREHERNLAIAWFDGKYDQEMAQLSAELQSLDFDKVKRIYGEMYHNAEAASNGYH